MKNFVLIIFLTITICNLKAQPCIKIFDYVKGITKIYSSGDKIFLVYKNSNKEKYFKISSITDSGFVSTKNQFISYKDIYGISYGNTWNNIFYYYLLTVFAGIPFSMLDKNNSPFYTSNTTVIISVSAITTGLGAYLFYKLRIQNGFRKIHTIDENKFELKYFNNISKTTN